MLDLESKVTNLMNCNKSTEAKLWNTLLDGFYGIEVEEVESVMAAYYSSFNKKNADDMQILWLPDESSELVIPGFMKKVSRTTYIAYQLF
jgi:hypothetical protein